jgi:hypothetical protein
MSWRLGRWSEHLLARLVRIVGGGPAFLEPGAVAADATTWGHQAATRQLQRWVDRDTSLSSRAL